MNDPKEYRVEVLVWCAVVGMAYLLLLIMVVHRINTRGPENPLPIPSVLAHKGLHLREVYEDDPFSTPGLVSYKPGRHHD